MDMPALNSYLGRAKFGNLSTKEFNEIAKLLESSSDDRTQWICIVILGWDGDADHSALVKRFLNSTDKFVQEEAVRFLICDARRPDLCHNLFMEWLGNNDDDFATLTAVQAAGDAYKVTREPFILERLLHFMAKTNEDPLEEEDAFSESAKSSLIRALTPDYNDQSPEAKLFRASKPTIDDLKRQAEEILRRAKR